MIQITFLKERALAQLIPGACPFARLWENLGIFFKDESQLRQMLSDLLKNCFVESRHYINSSTGQKYALYVLGQAGINWLVEKGLATADEIRTLLPSAHTVSHELIVTDIVRQLRKESSQLHYSLV